MASIQASAVEGAPLPGDEEERLQTLSRYEILDSVSEREYDDLTLLASYICDTPVALITLVDRDRQWFKSRIGMPASETSRDVSFCAHAILGEQPFVVPDATMDRRFERNPLVTGDPKIRFYAGVPLFSGEKHRALGTLCVIDRVPRQLSQMQTRLLEALARQVQALFELRLKLLEEKRLSRTDPLTGAANRRSFFEMLESEIARLTRYHRPMSVAYVDLDNLKQINDRLGHEVGDQVLTAVAQTVQKHLRLGDAIARLGGDEFAILLKEAGAESARQAVDRLRRHLLDAMDKEQLGVTFSVGLVTCERPPASAQQVVTRADELMYQVKRAGKNGVLYAALN